MPAGDDTWCARRAHPRAIVLQSSVDVVGVGHVEAHVIELRHGKVRKESPVCSLIERLVDASVSAHEQLIRILRIDPQRMHVAMHACTRLTLAHGKSCAETLAPVFAHGEKKSWLVHAIGILGIDREPRKIERPPAYIERTVDLGPPNARIIGPEP